MSNMNFLIEEVNLDLIENQIIEEENKPKKYIIKGPYLEADVKNRNKRIYPKPVIEKQVENFQQLIKERRSLGELKHPDSIEIDPERASHLITKLEMNKNIAYGESVVLDTPTGKIVKALIDEGVKLGVSSRGYGSLKEGIVQPDYKLVTIDIVMNPSAPSAFVEGIVESAIEWVVKDGIILPKEAELLENEINKIKDEVKPTNFDKDKYKEAAIKAFKLFLESLKEKLD